MTGRLDLVLAKRRAGDDRGRLVWRDRLAWIGGAGHAGSIRAPLPLILYNAAQHHADGGAGDAGTGRADVADRLHQRQPERAAGRRAGGLGVTVHARGLMPEGLVEMPAASRLPELGEVEFVVLGARSGSARSGGGAGRDDPGERGPAAAGGVEAGLSDRGGWTAGHAREELVGGAAETGGSDRGRLAFDGREVGDAGVDFA